MKGIDMKAVILAGGSGTRLSEETESKPKPLVEIGGRPILLHIMETFSLHGVTEFVILVGYKGHQIKEFFLNYRVHIQDVEIDLAATTIKYLDTQKQRPAWKISVIDTGDSTMTGGRLLRVRDHLHDEESFFFTYGDGVADIDLTRLRNFHHAHQKIATVTAVSPPGRFGALDIDGTVVKEFVEKPVGDRAFINGGYFVLNQAVFDYLDGDDCVFEQEPLKSLTENGELQAYIHRGFWHGMDTLRDKRYLDDLCAQGKPPWLERTWGNDK